MYMRYAALVVLIVSWMAGMPARADVALQDFEGHKREIKEFVGNGKWLVVMIWAHDCFVCNQEAHNYVDFHHKHKDKDASMLGVSIDGQGKKAQAEEFIKRHKVDFPNLILEADGIMRMYVESTADNSFGTPSFMVYNPAGKLVGAQMGAIPPELIEKFIEKEASTSVSKKSTP